LPGRFRKFRRAPEALAGRNEITADHSHTAAHPLVVSVLKNDPPLLLDLA
jgi:hypothetical protein